MRNPLKAVTAQQIIASRLLILQSKRLVLHSLQRRLEETGMEPLRQRVERVRMETELAQYAYRSTVLSLGSPENADYWLVAYERLIEMGHVLTVKLREASRALPPADRYHVSADVEMLEEIVSRWTEAMRKSMIESVA